MTTPARILVVDDDTIATPLCGYLARFGFETRAVRRGTELRAAVDAFRADLVVIDLALPGNDGPALAHLLRAVLRVPFIVATSHGTPADRIVGLELGADDVMDKPCEPRELVARIQTVLRRVGAGAGAHAAAAATDRIRFDGWELQRIERCLISPQGRQVPLSTAEYQLLSVFLGAPRRVVSRDQLLSKARGRSADAVDRSIDLLVSRLRHKLMGGDDSVALIKTVRGAGYLFDVRSVQGLGLLPG